MHSNVIVGITISRDSFVFCQSRVKVSRDWPNTNDLSATNTIHLTLKVTSAQVVETSVTNNSSFQSYTHPDDHTIPTTDTPGFKPFRLHNFILLSFLQTWTNAIPQFRSVTRVPRVRIPLVLIAAYATGLGLFFKMENIVLVRVTWIVVHGFGKPWTVVSESYISCCNCLLHSTLKPNWSTIPRLPLNNWKKTNLLRAASEILR